MIERPMTQDILKYKAKFVGNFTSRETVFLGLGGMAALLCYLFPFSGLETTIRIYASAAVAIPFFLFGFYRPFGQNLETILSLIIFDNLICPAIRLYEIKNPEYEKFTEEDLSKSKKVQKKKNPKITGSKEFKAIR